MVSDAVKKEFWGWFRLVNLWLIVFPTKCALFALIFAGPIALIEDAKFSDGFLYLLQVLTGASIPLTDWGGPAGGPPPKEVWGLIIANAMGIMRQLILSLHIGLTAGPMIEGWLDWDVGIWGCCVSGKLLVVRTQFFKKYVIFFLNVAIFCVVFSFAAGGVLAAAESWPYWNGFVMVLGEVTSSATVLPDQGKMGPATSGGRFVGFIVGVVAAAILGIIIAIASVPLLGFDLAYDNTAAVRGNPRLLLNMEQMEKIGVSMGPPQKGTVKSGWKPEEDDDAPKKPAQTKARTEPAGNGNSNGNGNGETELTDIKLDAGKAEAAGGQGMGES